MKYDPISPFRSRRVMALCLAATAASPATADIILWECSAGGAYSDPGCWDAASLPDFADTAIFDVGGSYSLLTDQTREVDYLLISDDVTFGLGGAYKTWNSMDIVSNVVGQSASFTLAYGAMETSSLVLGGFPEMPGHLNLRAGATMTYGYSITYPGSTITFGINTSLPSATSVMSQYGGGDPLFNSTLHVEAQEGQLPAAGSMYTLMDFGLFGVGHEFAAVITSPPIGQQYLVAGNEFGSSQITVTIEDRTWMPVPEVRSVNEPPSDPPAMAIGDLDGDGIDDIITATPGTLTILSNTGTGDVGLVSEYVIASDPIGLVAEDFDGDGTIDIVVLDRLAASMTFFYNPDNDPSMLQDSESYSTESNPVAIVSCNLGDSSESAFVSNRLRDTVVFSKGPGKATGYRSNGSSSAPSVIGWVEIEDDPGPADSTDDEERDDDDTNVAVGHTGASGFAGRTNSASITMIRTDDSGTISLVSNTEIESTPTSITFARLADLGGIFEEQVVVGTEAGSINIFNASGEALASFPFGEHVLAVEAGDLDGMDVAHDDLIISGSIDGEHTIELFSNGGLGTAITLQRTSSVIQPARVPHLLVGPLYNIIGIQNGVTGFMTDSTEAPREIFLGIYNRTILLPCSAADFDGNGQIDGGDIGVLIAAWGQCPESSCPWDLNLDGTVNGTDLGLFLNYWGPCSP